MFKNETLDTRSVGKLGEDIAAQYLLQNGYEIVERNFSRKWGELDLIVRKKDKVIFVEVKTVSYETRSKLQYAVTHETWRPEEQVHRFKFHQIEKTLQTWVSSNHYEGEWQIDVLAVRIVPRETFATVLHIPNIIRD